MLRIWIILLLSCCWAGNGAAQTLISGNAVLATARQDLAVDLQGRQISFMQENQKGLPFVEQIGFRTETDRFELRRQEYLARINVNGLAEMRQQRRLLQAEQREEESRLRIFLHEALLERYQALAVYQVVQRRLALQRELLLVYEDQVNVLQKMAAENAGADVADLIRAEYDRDELILDIAASESRLQQLRQVIDGYFAGAAGNWQLDTSGFIQTQEIARVVAQFPQTVLQHPEATEKQADMDRIDAEYALEKAQARQIPDFLQFRHHNRPEEGFNRAFSIGLGINLPYKGSARVKTSELKIEKNEAAQDLQVFLAGLNRQIAAGRQQIGALAQRHQLVEKQWADSQARFTLDQAALLRDTGPLPLLEAREGQLKRQSTLLDIESEMLEHYLEILDNSGLLSDLPLINYLSSGLTPF